MPHERRMNEAFHKSFTNSPTARTTGAATLGEVIALASIPVLRENVSVHDFGSQILEFCERAAALFLLVLAAPVLLVILAVVTLLSRRSPLIAHRRVGWRGSTLWMLKVRTMWGSAGTPRRAWLERIDDVCGPARKLPDDERVTSSFAHFCRRHSLDELPQLWHVLRGEMSLIGPRPLTLGEIRQYYRDAAGEMLRVKPGLAGLWQVSGRNRLTYDERRRLDLEFVRQRSFRLYLRIIVRTLPEIWNGANTW
jgi:lipopolysaccharide/colanic/teichoic acid biosynthesis glycosyltransferase